MFKERPVTWVPREWPIVLALAVVTLLIGGTLVLDMLLGQRVAAKTDEIIGNSLRSGELVGDMRTQIRRFLNAPDSRKVLDSMRAGLERDAREYDRLARYPGEREEWRRLQDLFEDLPTVPAGERPKPELVAAIHDSVDRLVAINNREARLNAATIRAAQRDGVLGDAAIGSATFALVLLVCALLLRVLRRQRKLVTERVQLLDEKNAELESFAGRAAHDLRAPLNPVRGYADLILEGQRSPQEIAMMAQRIRKGVDRLTHVIDDMLALSISGHPAPGQASPAAVVAALVEEMGPELHGVELTTHLASGPVACSEGVLGQILRNLVSNAVKFRSRARAPKIAVEALDAGAMVELAVEDNGMGVDAESAKHAFEPFYRAHSTADVPGHGLGLAIVERTVHALGGTSEMSSVPERGTRVVIRLPHGRAN